MVFFKTPKMRGYAHPIEGTEPTQWCNEEKEEAPEKPVVKPTETYNKDYNVNKKYEVDPTRKSIESQVALKCATELAVAGKIGNSEIISYAKAFEAFLSGLLVVKDDNIFRQAVEHCTIKKEE